MRGMWQLKTGFLKTVLQGWGSLPIAIALFSCPARAESSPMQEPRAAAAAQPVFAQTLRPSLAPNRAANLLPKLAVASLEPLLEDALHQSSVGTTPPMTWPSPGQASALSPSNALGSSTLWISPLAQAPADAPPSPPAETSPAPASTQPGGGDRWQFSVEPYFFVPLDVRADITVAGRSASFRAGLGDILDLDRAFDAGIRLEARKNRFGILFDGFYLSAGQGGRLNVTIPQSALQSVGINAPSDIPVSADASVAIRQGTLDLAAFYRVVDVPLGNAASPYPRLTIDPMAGLRVNILRQELEVDRIRVGPQTVAIDREFSLSRTNVEPLLGARFELSLAERWAMILRGDVSGFNISADRNLTWNFLVGTRYRLSPSTALQLAYTFNGSDFADGSGLTRSSLNLRQQGLWLSVMFQF
jgi:hypothetical protein